MNLISDDVPISVVSAYQRRVKIKLLLTILQLLTDTFISKKKIIILHLCYLSSSGCSILHH